MKLKKFKRKKRTEKELFQRLRYDSITVGVALLVFLVFKIYTEFIDDQILKIALFVGGALLIYSSSQKYLEDHPKMRRALVWALIGVMMLGVGVFVYATIKLLITANMV